MRAYGRVRRNHDASKAARRWEYRYVAGAAASIALLRPVVLPRLRAHLRSVCRTGQLLDDDRVHDRHLRAQLRQRPFRGGADLLRLGADDRGAAALRQSLPLDLRRSAHPLVLGTEIHRRAAAPHAARCRDRLARHVACWPRVSTPRSTTCRTACACSTPSAVSSCRTSKLNQQLGLAPDFELKGLSMRAAGGKRRRRRPAIRRQRDKA